VKYRQPLPWRVFGFIGLLIVVTAFAALNLDHRSDVSLGFHTFAAVPVFLTSLIAFTLGAVLAVALTMPRRRVARDLPPAPQLGAAPDAEVALPSGDEAVAPDPPAEAEAETEADDSMEELEAAPGRKARRRWFGVRRKEGAD